MIPTDKEELRMCLNSWLNKHRTEGTLKSTIRIARELKNHIGNEFVSELENEYRDDYGTEALKQI